MADTLPEGTDHILPGATATERDRDEPDYETTNEEAAHEATASKGSGTEGVKADAGDLRDAATAKFGDFRAQATDKAREYADEGKARASAGLDSVAKMIGDSADQIDEKLGGSYGDYVRRAGDAVSGFSTSLRDKDVEELFEDARDLVRRSPAIAIGAAAAAGFVLSRIIKAGSEALDESARAAEPKKSPGNDADDIGAAPKKSGKGKSGASGA